MITPEETQKRSMKNYTLKAYRTGDKPKEPSCIIPLSCLEHNEFIRVAALKYLHNETGYDYVTCQQEGDDTVLHSHGIPIVSPRRDFYVLTRNLCDGIHFEGGREIYEELRQLPVVQGKMIAASFILRTYCAQSEEQETARSLVTYDKFLNHDWEDVPWGVAIRTHSEGPPEWSFLPFADLKVEHTYPTYRRVYGRLRPFFPDAVDQAEVYRSFGEDLEKADPYAVELVREMLGASENSFTKP